MISIEGEGSALSVLFINYVFYCKFINIYNTQEASTYTISYALSHEYEKEAHKRTKLERSKLKDKQSTLGKSEAVWGKSVVLEIPYMYIRKKIFLYVFIQ